MRIVTKEEAAVRLGIHPNTVVNYLQRCPGAGVRDRKRSRAMLVDIDGLAEWMRVAMPDKYGDLVIDDRELPLEQLGQTVYMPRQQEKGKGPEVAEPIDVEAVGVECGDGYGDRGRVVGLLAENLQVIQESHRETVVALTGQVAARRWVLRAVTAAVVVLAAMAGGMGWYLSRAQAVAIERAERIGVDAVRMGRMVTRMEMIEGRAGRLAAGLSEAVAGREALGERLVAAVEEKGRLELLVSQGEDERAGKDRLILEMSGRIDELEEGIRHEALGTRGDEEEDGKRVEVVGVDVYDGDSLAVVE